MANRPKNPTSTKIHDYWYYICILSVTFISLRFDTKTQDPFNLPKLASLVLFLWLPLFLVIRKLNTRPNKLVTFAFAFSGGFFIALIVSALKTVSFYQSFVGVYQRNLGVATYVFFILIMLGTALNSTFRNSKFTLLTFVILGSLQSIYGLVQQLGADPFPWDNPYNPMIGTFGNPNFSSAFLGCSAVAALTLIFQTSLKMRLLLGIQVILSLSLVINSNSSQGLMAFVIGASFFLAGIVFINHRRLFWPVIAAIGLFGTLGLLGILKIGPLGFLYQGSIAARGDYWRTAISMWKSSPLGGVGFDQYGDYFGVHRDLAQVVGRGYLTQSDNAHNTFLHFLATTGLLGFICYVGLHLLILISALKQLRKAQKDQSIRILTVMSVWVSFLSIGLISPDNLGVTVWQWVFAGIVLGLIHIKEENHAKYVPNKSYFALISCMVLVLVPSSIFATKLTVADKCVWNTYLVGYSGTKTLPELNSLMSSCISKSPSEERYLALATSFSMGLKEYKEAIKYSDLLLKQNSRSSDALRLSAYSFEALQDFNGAITRRKLLEQVDPFELQNLKDISLDFVALNDKPNALIYRDKIKNIDPKSGFVEEINAKLAG